MKKLRIFKVISVLALAAAGVFGLSTMKQTSQAKQAEPVQAADYSSTIRVYVDLDWGSIDYVRLGTDQATGNAVLSSSNAKYNQSLGKYVRDISSTSTYDKMGCFFSQSSQWWQYQYDGGYVWISGGFKPGYEYQIKSIGYVSEGGGVKYFAATPYEIGEITDNVSNATVYFVDGHSWNSSGSVYVHFWGGTASSTYPGGAMTDTGLRLKAYVGETEYSGLHIYKYTISGSAAYVQFNNNSSKTGDLRPVNGQVYFYGVSAETYGIVANFLVDAQSKMGSYTYAGKSFTKSICAMSQSQASSFISTYDELATNHGSGVASSVAGSGIVTYTSPETSTSVTGEVSLAEIRSALIRKYPSINPNGARFGLLTINENTNTVAIIVIVSLVSLSAIGGYFFVRRKREQN